MSLKLKRNDQETVINIAKDFVTFYYTRLNNKNFEDIKQHLRDYTIFSSQKVRYRGTEILTYFDRLCSLNVVFTDIDFDTLHAGARRINVIVSGKITYNENSIKVTKYFTEYIHFGSDNNGKMWIQISMMKIF